MESCASFRARRNSRSPLPTALPASGSRRAPNTSSTTSSRMRISPPLRLPSISPPLLVETLRLTARGEGRGGGGGRSGARRGRLVARVLQAALELLDPLTQRRADLRDPLRAEHQHQHEQQDQDVTERQVPKHTCLASEDRSGEEVGDHYAHERQQRHVEPDRTERDRHRSEEHTSELQSLAYLVCRLLLEKKKRNQVQQGVRT